MKKILLFEPWHLGDVAVALFVSRQFLGEDVEFALAGNKKWKEWALSTGVVKHFIEFVPPWAAREKKKKYNPLNYKINDFIQFKKEVRQYNPNVIIELRGDIRAKAFLNVLFWNAFPVRASRLSGKANVYRRGETIQAELGKSFLEVVSKAPVSARGAISVFFGATDLNRMVPEQVAIGIVAALYKKGYMINWILQPTDDREKFEKIKSASKFNNVELVQGSINEITDTLEQSSMLVSTDSSWLHIAKFYGTPVIGLFGFNTMQTWLPPDAQCITPETIYPEHYRYQNRYQSLQPLMNLNPEKIAGFVQELEMSQNRKPVNPDLKIDC